MKTFFCDFCGHLIYFENTRCIRCASPLGYIPEKERNTAFKIEKDGVWRRIKNDEAYKPCKNHVDHNACNWMLPYDSTDDYCFSCKFTRTIPDLLRDKNLSYWYKIEKAKRRLIYNILRLKLPLENKFEDPERGLAFDFLESIDLNMKEIDPVKIGHSRGLITMNIDEANDAIRVKIRVEMKERYRTLLGHLRHEIGHYYWFLLFGNAIDGDEFRSLFGDEREDYSQALSKYYENQKEEVSPEYISRYASSHPWEDWAETWAHYMHMFDTLETAYAWGLNFNPKESILQDEKRLVRGDYSSINELIENWTMATGALNSLNRSMGLNDPYPFIISPQVAKKLEFVHETISKAALYPKTFFYSK